MKLYRVIRKRNCSSSFDKNTLWKDGDVSLNVINKTEESKSPIEGSWHLLEMETNIVFILCLLFKYSLTQQYFFFYLASEASSLSKDKKKFRCTKHKMKSLLLLLCFFIDLFLLSVSLGYRSISCSSFTNR